MARTTCVRAIVLCSSLTASFFASALHGQKSPSGPCITYETTRDFEQGYLQNLELFRNPDTGETCLRLKDNEDVGPWPFLAVAVSGFTSAASGDPAPYGQVRRGSVVRIATENLPQYGIAEGDVLGEYFTAPAGFDTNPSRTTVDAYGNIWVANRNDASPAVVNGPNRGSVTRVGLVLGGTRVDATGTPDPTGDYLQGPFAYCGCDDRDGDGLIRTSRGYPRTTGALGADYVPTALAWTNLPAGIDTPGGVASADDECITAFVRTEAVNVRHIAIDGNNDIWVGSWTNKRFEKLDNFTATQVSGSAFTALYGGYGGLVDACGVLWSANWDFNASQNQLMRYDPVTTSISYILNSGPPNNFDARNYGLAFDPATCFIWSSFPFDPIVRRFSPAGVPLAPFNHGSSATNRGITIEGSDVWIANSGSNTVSRISTNGTPIGLIPVNVGAIPGSTPHGVAADRNGMIWASNRITQNAVRIDPSLGAFGATDLAVDLGANAWAYNYSDQTGATLMKTAPQGSWTFIHDGGKTGCVWSTLDWTAVLTGGSQVIVQVRASDTPIPSGPWTNVLANTPITGVVGQYLQVRVTLKRGTILEGDCCRPAGEAVLCNLTICKEPSCTADIRTVLCALDGSGNVSVSFTVTNNSPLDAAMVLITPLPPGSGITAVPNIINQSIPVGSSRLLTVNFSGVTPGEPFCFIVTLLDESMQNCCSLEICVDPDCECFQITPGSLHVICDPEGNPGVWNATFTFDNLTPDILHHIFFFPPAGVTITPNYVALVPPVPPMGTSQPITISISGAVPGSQLCFMMSIHDIQLNECCTREICLDIPECDVKEPIFGACCYRIPGLAQPICAVMTTDECAALGGTFIGPATGCSPNPCIEPDPKEIVHLTAAVTCCWPVQQSVTTTLTICNPSSAARSYGWSIAGATGPGCTHIIDAMFMSPTSGVVTISPGGCVSIPITVQCEGLMNGSVSKACLIADVTNLATGNIASAQSVLNLIEAGGGLPLPPWCFDVLPPDHGPPIGVLVGDTLDTGFTIANTHGPDSGLSYRIAAGGVISLDGNPPGTIFSDYANITDGDLLTIPLEATFDEHVPLQIFDIVLLTDIDGDGQEDPVASVALISVTKALCATDIDCDGTIDFLDLLLVLDFWGPCSGCAADINDDGMVDLSDLLLVLAAWGPCSG